MVEHEGEEERYAEDCGVAAQTILDGASITVLSRQPKEKKDCPMSKVQGKIQTLLERVHDPTRPQLQKPSGGSCSRSLLSSTEWSNDAETIKEKLSQVRRTCEEAKLAPERRLATVRQEASAWEEKCCQEEAKRKALEEILRQSLQYIRAGGDSTCLEALLHAVGEKSEAGRNVPQSSSELFHPASDSSKVIPRPHLGEASQAQARMWNVPPWYRQSRQPSTGDGYFYASMPASANMETLGERYRWAGDAGHGRCQSRSSTSWCDCDDVGVEDHKLVGALVCKPSQSHSASTMSHRLGAEAFDELAISARPQVAVPRLDFTNIAPSSDQVRVIPEERDCGWIDQTCLVADERRDSVGLPPPDANPFLVEPSTECVMMARETCRGENSTYEATDFEVGTEGHNVEVGIFTCCPSVGRAPSEQASRNLFRPFNHELSLHATAVAPPTPL